MKRALLSVSNKDGILDFAKELANLGFELLSTGGTYKLLKEGGLEVLEVSDFTQSAELFEGRVKTLHPKIHGGILYKRADESHKKQAQEAEIKNIDLVCVNLYPFKQTTQKTQDFDEIVENIDIGGPSLLRAAAKNYKDVWVLCDKFDFKAVLESLKKNDKEDCLNLRQKLMIKAYEHTASYDAFIANYMNERFNQGFGAKKFIVGTKCLDT